MKARFALLMIMALVVFASASFAAPALPAEHFSGAFSHPALPQTATLPAAPGTFFYVVLTVDVNGLRSANSIEASATLIQGMKSGVTVSWTAPTTGVTAAIAGYEVYRSSITGGCTPITAVTCSKIASVIGGTTYLDPFVSPPASSGTTARVS